MKITMWMTNEKPTTAQIKSKDEIGSAIKKFLKNDNFDNFNYEVTHDNGTPVSYQEDIK